MLDFLGARYMEVAKGRQGDHRVRALRGVLADRRPGEGRASHGGCGCPLGVGLPCALLVACYTRCHVGGGAMRKVGPGAHITTSTLRGTFGRVLPVCVFSFSVLKKV